MSARLIRRFVSACFGATCWLAAVLLGASPANSSGASEPAGAPLAATVRAAEWARFRDRFVTPDGRVVDLEQEGISHSEGQSYGLYLALQAGDQATFDRILAFTFRHMRRTGDALVSWRYDPRASVPVTDRNNASDGDILIAYALLGAAARWHEPRYEGLARPMIADIGRLLFDTRKDGLVLLRPGVFGFDDGAHGDGPVVNLSYYVYGALLAFATVDTRYPFFKAWQSGLVLTEQAMAQSGHAPDWISMRTGRQGRPAPGFPQRSSYDAVRIPLFMALGGRVPARYLAAFDRSFNLAGGGTPGDVDLATGRTVGRMTDSGYRAIAALTACAVRNVPFPSRLQQFRPGTYFSSALHLMALSAARAHYPQCLDAAGAEAIEVAVQDATPVTWPDPLAGRRRRLSGLDFMRANPGASGAPGR